MTLSRIVDKMTAIYEHFFKVKIHTVMYNIAIKLYCTNAKKCTKIIKKISD